MSRRKEAQELAQLVSKASNLPGDEGKADIGRHTAMLEETRLDEFHSCKQGSGGGRFAWLGGLLSTRRTTRLTSATILDLFASLCSRSRSGAGGRANLVNVGCRVSGQLFGGVLFTGPNTCNSVSSSE